MKYVSIIPAFLAAAALSSVATAQDSSVRDFSEADMNSDGQLSIEEAREAFPQTVIIEDSNNDGLVNLQEADTALEQSELSLAEPGTENQVVGEEDYVLIITAIEEQQGQQSPQSSQSPQSGEGR